MATVVESWFEPISERELLPQKYAGLFLPLELAHLCQDCQCVSAHPVNCPRCAGANLLRLWPVLQREGEGGG